MGISIEVIPCSSFEGRGIDKYFKDAKIIFLVRDGRDVLTSGTFNWMNKMKNFKKSSSFKKSINI